MTKEENYIRSQQHFEDNVNAYYDQKESEQSQQDNREQVDDRCQMTDILNELESLRSENERMKAEREWMKNNSVFKLPENVEDVEKYERIYGPPDELSEPLLKEMWDKIKKGIKPSPPKQ